MKIVIDAGHGINTSGKRSPDGMREFSFNSVVANYMKAELLMYQNVEVLFTHDPSGAVDVPLKTRTDKANTWKADVFVSIHANASTGKMGTWGGIDTFVYAKGGEAHKLATLVQSNLIKATKLRDRGVKTANFAVVRDTKMPAILIEHGFMDSITDLPYLKSDAYRKLCGVTNATSVAQYYGLKRKATVAPKPAAPATSVDADSYKVVSGDTLWAISQKFNISVDDIKSLNGLKSNTISVGQVLKVKKKVDNTDSFYRVFVSNKQVGAYSIEKNALEEGWKQYNSGKKDAYLTNPSGAKYVFNDNQADNPNKPATPAPTPDPTPTPTKGTSIIGNSVAKVEQMISFVQAKNPGFDGKIAEAFLKVGNKYGVRGDIAFCQSIIETGWFKFTGGTAVTPDQHNYCGMGVTSKGMKGASFDTIEDGVAAQIQHLFAYASKASLPAGEKLLDPRFKYVTRGIAPNWEDLSNRWAMNPNYGAHILSMYAQLLLTPIPTVKPEPEVPKTHVVQKTEQKEVFFTATEIGHDHFESVVIDGKGYISASDAAKLLGFKAVYDKLLKEIIFIKE